MDEGQQLQVILAARLEKYERDMLRARNTTDRRFREIEGRTKRAGQNMEKSLQSSTARINGILAGLGAGAALQQLNQLAEAWTDLSSRVNIAAGDQEKGAAVMSRISEIARRTYSDLGQTAEAYISNAGAMRELGYSTQTTLDFMESVNNALVVSGAKGQRAESVMNALNKAMALGKLSGDELNTVLGSGGRVAEALAAGLGVGVNQLRKLGQEGKLTGDVIVKALTSQLTTLREEADAMPATISDAFVLLKNSLTEYVGKLNEAGGVTSVFVDGLIFAADNIGSVAQAAAAAGAVILSSYVPGLVRAAAAQAAIVATNPFLAMAAVIGAATFALAAFGDQITPIEGDLANLQDYASVAWTGIKSGVVDAANTINDVLIGAINMIAGAITGAETSFESLGAFMKRVVNQIVGEFVFLYRLVTDVFGKIPAAVADAAISAMNGMIATIESGLNAVINAVNTTVRAINSIGDHVGITFGEIGNVTLGRIENSFAGAGEAAGKAYGEALQAAAEDHVGKALGAWREAANANAAKRIAQEGAGDGGTVIDSVDNPITPPGAGGSGKGKRGGRGGGGGSKENDFDRTVKQLQERIAAIRAENDARQGLTGTIEEQEAALEKARIKHELMTAAQNAGMAITPQLEAQIDQLAQSYVDASSEAQRFADSQQQAQQTAQEWANLAGSVVSGFINDLRQGKTASEAFANALNKIVDKLIDMMIQMLIVKPLMGMFGFAGGGFVSGGGGGLFASGGYTGPGAKFEPAGVVHKGEFVMSKAATERLGVKNLDMLHQAALRGYAEGGFVGGDSSERFARAIHGDGEAGPAAQAIQINAPITVNGSAGTPQQNADLAKKMRKEMEATMRGVVADEIRVQMRPGNMLNR